MPGMYVCSNFLNVSHFLMKEEKSCPKQALGWANVFPPVIYEVWSHPSNRPNATLNRTPTHLGCK